VNQILSLLGPWVFASPESIDNLRPWARLTSSPMKRRRRLQSSSVGHVSTASQSRHPVMAWLYWTLIYSPAL